MSVQFITGLSLNDSSGLNGRQRAEIDVPYFRRYVAAVEDAGFDYALAVYSSGYHDPWSVANQVIANSERLAPIIALRPNTLHPTVAAKALATIDQFGDGRLAVHLIAGGNDVDQAREGDYVSKERRYRRMAEFIDILHRAWDIREPFSHEGEFYRFDDFVSTVRPSRDRIPLSVGGSSADAYQVGGSRADIFAFQAEPIQDIRY